MKIENAKLREFFEKGTAFIKAKKATGSDPCEAIRPGTAEWNAWGGYFRDCLGAFPAFFLEVERNHQSGDKKLSFTAPAQWPWWIESLGYRQPEIINYRPPVRVRGRSKEDWDMMNANEAWRREFARKHPVQAEKIFAGTAFDKFADGRFDHIGKHKQAAE